MKLANYLSNYRNSPEYQGLQEGAQAVIDDLWEAAFGLQEQIRVETATWGLDKWEEMLGIAQGIGMTNEARRERLFPARDAADLGPLLWLGYAVSEETPLPHGLTLYRLGKEG